MHLLVVQIRGALVFHAFLKVPVELDRQATKFDPLPTQKENRAMIEILNRLIASTARQVTIDFINGQARRPLTISV